MLRSLLALIRIDLQLALRARTVIFFNYLFPLVFFFAFAEFYGAKGNSVSQVVSMVLVIGILGNGLWGAGMRLVQEREANILRRYRVTPISPLPILLASMITGWLLYLPALVMICGLARVFYGMPIPAHWVSLIALITVGLWTFRALGLIVASVANGVQESTVLIQLLYMPMLFLSGSAIPLALLPKWAQVAGQFLPATYLITGIQGVFLKGETFFQNIAAAGAMLLASGIGLFISTQIFRWEKDEKLPRRSRIYVAAVLAPFLAMGIWQAYTKENIHRATDQWRQANPEESRPPSRLR
ncbi:MAG: ABC transporter permease [Bryobacteraceae bacterium]